MDNTSLYSNSFCGDYKVKHILIKPIISMNMSAEEVEAAEINAKKTAENIIIKLENGEDWSGLVRKYSDDKVSSLRDGLIQNFTRGNIEDHIYDEVVRLKDGRYTKNPIESKMGYHILLRVCATKESEKDDSPEEENDTNTESSSTIENIEGKNGNYADSSYVENHLNVKNTLSDEEILNQLQQKNELENAQILDKIEQENITMDQQSVSELQHRNIVDTIETLNIPGMGGMAVDTNVGYTLNHSIHPTQVQDEVALNVESSSRINTGIDVGIKATMSAGSTTGDGINLVTDKSNTSNPNENQMNINVSTSLNSKIDARVGVDIESEIQGTSSLDIELNGTENPKKDLEIFGVATQGVSGAHTNVGIADGDDVEEIELYDEPTVISNNDDEIEPIEVLDDDMEDSPVSDDRDEEAGEPDNDHDESIERNDAGGDIPNTRNPFFHPNVKNSDDSKRLQERLQKSRGSHLSRMNPFNRNRESDEENNDNDGENDRSKSLNPIVHSHRKPVDSEAAKEAAANLFSFGGKLKQKVIIVTVLTSFFILLIVIVAIAGNEEAASSNSEERNNYLYGSGTEEDLTEYLISMDYCSSKENCPSTPAYKYYQKLKQVLDSNRNLTKKEADIFITNMIEYDRTNEEAFEAIDEIDYIANIIGNSGSFSIENADKYRDEFIKDEGYFMTYRKEDLLSREDSLMYREKLYEKIIKSIESDISLYDKETEVVSNLTICPGITVTGENAGTYDLEEYIAKVISNENDWAPDGNLENNKAQAVAARTYALRRTNNCTKPIENSTSAQTMKDVASSTATAATNEVSGQVLVNREGNYISTEYDAFCLSHSDENNYYIMQKNIAIPKSWALSHGIPTSYLTNTCGTEGDGGHGRGMSQWGSRYLSTQGYSYTQILSTFYTDAQIMTLPTATSGLTFASNGFIKRTSRALRDNEYFYGDGATNEGECAWYAVRRTNEILGNIGSNYRVTSGGNGGDFCYSSQYDQFNHITDVNLLRPGMVISWSGGTNHSYGHVAIVEDVYYDENGNVTSVDLSEGSNSAGTGYGNIYKGNYVNNNFIWNSAGSADIRNIRQYTCEGSLTGSTGSGCQSFVNVPVNDIKNRWKSYKFVCAIDLLS